MEMNPQKKRSVLLIRESEDEPARALPVPTSTPRYTEAGLRRGMVAATGLWDGSSSQAEQGSDRSSWPRVPTWVWPTVHHQETYNKDKS